MCKRIGIVLLAVLILSMTGCRYVFPRKGDITAYTHDIDVSARFTAAEIDNAISVAAAYFEEHYEECVLDKIIYEEDFSNRQVMDSDGNVPPNWMLVELRFTATKYNQAPYLAPERSSMVYLLLTREGADETWYVDHTATGGIMSPHG